MVQRDEDDKSDDACTQILGIILICISAIAMQATLLLTTPVVGGLAAMGIFLFIVALLGMIGVVMANQALIFLYLVFMSFIGFIQFCVAIACLSAFNKARRTEVLLSGWEEASNDTRQQVQSTFGCCGLDSKHVIYSRCEELKLPCCILTTHNCTGCPLCMSILDNRLQHAFQFTGGMGLLFTFLQLGGILLAWWYRRQPVLGFGHDILN
ncbi:tetraspanin-31-B-like isoform X2 [Acanthaster planci]|uniref:Tetraspanin-31-B-like isoform X2 n=1 Tax=Acanthaster planci TaxID=133434 RepID=A0A8B7Y3V5_ACAPL|nr:tetraspanin-31-B-like isoform X2 [Acanthaster planci]